MSSVYFLFIRPVGNERTENFYPNVLNYYKTIKKVFKDIYTKAVDKSNFFVFYKGQKLFGENGVKKNWTVI